MGFNSSATSMAVYEQLSALVRPKIFDQAPEVESFRQAMDAFGYTPETLMKDLMQPCDRLIRQCYWLNQEVNCSKLFYLSKSTEGFCCSFNYKGLHGQE